MLVHLDSLDHPGVLLYRGLKDPELVHRRGLFIAEGRLVVERLLGWSRYTVRSVLLSPSAFEALRAPLATLPPQVPVFIAALEQFTSLTGVNVHRGCLALVEHPQPCTPHSVLAEARTVLVLEGVSNPDNVGGIFRNAAAFGVDGILLGPRCGDPYYRKAIRTSMAATLRIPFAHLAEWPDGLDSLRTAGFLLVALTPSSSAVSLDEFASLPRPARLAFMLGAEGEGLSTDAIERADSRVRIPMREDVDSVNVAVAAGIALSRVFRPAP